MNFTSWAWAPSLMLAVSAAGAQSIAINSTQDVTVHLSAARIVAAAPGGAEIRAAADSAKPGEVIEYRAVYHNTGKSPARAVQATLPVPVGTEFIVGAPAAGLRASLDGKTYQPLPLTRRVKRADGQTVEVPVPLAEIRSLRWDLGEMPAQRETVVSARVRVQTGAVVAASAAAK
jgi:uncharacterized repeat protein (TIGR01451 family)